MLSLLLPEGVAVAESRTDPPEAELYPEEADLVRRSVQKRQQEFTTVRHCARQALGVLGLPPGPVLPDRHGAPRWPPAVVGSLTHCDGYRAAALAHRTHLTMLGIDAEPHAPLPHGILESIALRSELAWARAAPPGLHRDRLLFSAKESVYKAWYPHTGQRLEFEDAELAFGPTGDGELPAGGVSGEFTATLLARPPAPAPGTAPLPSRLRGRWLVTKGLVLTAVVTAAQR